MNWIGSCGVSMRQLGRIDPELQFGEEFVVDCGVVVDAWSR